MKFDKTKFKKVLEDYIANEEKDVARHELICKALEQFEGKSPSKHILKAFPEGYKLDHIAGMTSIVTTDNTNHLLAYDSNFVIKIEDFRRFDACHGSAAAERAKQIRDVLKSASKFEKAFRYFNEVNETFKKLGELAHKHFNGPLSSYHFPADSTVFSSLKIDGTILSDIYFKKS